MTMDVTTQDVPAKPKRIRKPKVKIPPTLHPLPGRRVFWGFDPGGRGATARLEYNDDDLVTVEVWPFQFVDTPSGVPNFNMVHVTNLLVDRYREDDYLFVEHVHAYPGQGVSSTFSFGLSTGALYGVISATTGRMPHRVPPMNWKRHLGLLKTEKVETLVFIRRFFGDWVPPDLLGSGTSAIACADALGIALYGRNLVQRGLV